MQLNRKVVLRVCLKVLIYDWSMAMQTWPLCVCWLQNKYILTVLAFKFLTYKPFGLANV